MASNPSTTTSSAGFPAVAVAPAGPPNEYAVTAKEPAPSAPPIPGMGTDAHSAQEALDKVAQEPSFLGKMANMAQPYLAKMDAVTQPYVEKVQTTAKPYTDAATTKARELMEKIDGPAGAETGAVPTVTERRGSKGLGPETYGPGSAASSTTAGEKPGLFDTITQTVADFTHKVDERTASADKPGLITQLTSAVQKVTDKADAYIGSHAPNATNATSVIGHPVQTTTNSVPHTDNVTTSTSIPVSAQHPEAAAAAPALTSAPAPGAIPVVPTVSGGAPIGGVPSAQA